MSKRAYARQCGVSEATIRKAVEVGHISKGVDKETGKIKPEIADDEWYNYHLVRQKNKAAAAGMVDETAPPAVVAKPGKVKAKAKKIKPEDLEGGEALLDEEDTEGDDIGWLSKAELERRNEAMKLKHAQLKYAVAKGLLVKRDDVYSALFVAGQEIRSALQAIPDRVIDNIIAASGQSRAHAHQVLVDELNKVLVTLSDMGERGYNLNGGQGDAEDDTENGFD